MRDYNLADDFVDVDAERALIAAVARDPARYWEISDDIARDVFAVEREAWQAVEEAVLAERAPEPPAGWVAGDDPVALARRLADLALRRLIASATERFGQAVFDETKTAKDIAALLEAEALALQTAFRQAAADRLLWASDLLSDVLIDAEERRRQREETGKPVMGIPTGIPKLDELLGGLETGLTLLAGAPGGGKTSLALQLAATAAAAGYPCTYATFENSPLNLTLKAIAGRAGVDTRDVRRGFVDLAKLQRGAEEWRPIAQRIAMIEGTSKLSIAQLRAIHMRALRHHGARRGLIVVDYLQLWAKASDDLRGLASVRERVEAMGAGLRELSLAVDSPVLALVSQNRAGGDYGDGKGKAALDSLKESGDLEYAADVVMFLTAAKDRHAVAPARAVDLTVAKNRNGATGRVDLVFRPDEGRLLEERVVVAPRS